MLKKKCNTQHDLTSLLFHHIQSVKRKLELSLFDALIQSEPASEISHHITINFHDFDKYINLMNHIILLIL